MASPFDYGTYFEALQKVGISVRLGTAGSFDGTAVITSLKDDLAWIELYGNEQPPVGTVGEGAEASLSAWTGGALCRCDGVVETVRSDRQFSIRLAGRIRELQRREYFRLDVELPFLAEPLGRLSPDEAEQRWRADRMELWRQPEMVPHGSSFMVVGWAGGVILPRRANLSGGGMRFRARDVIESGTLLAVTLFLSLTPPRAVCAIAETLRCQEISLSLQPGIHYSLSLRFTLISEKDRETIISYLFSEQRRDLMAKNARLPLGGPR